MTPRTAPTVDVKTAQSCPLCHDPLTSLPQLLACPSCQTIHHQACVHELGHCGTMGCGGLHDLAGEAGAAPARLQSVEASRVLAAGAYLGNLIGAALLLPFLVFLYARGSDDGFARLHAKQAGWLGLLTILTLGLAVPFTLLATVYGGLKAYQGEWWVLPGLRGEPWSPRLLRRISEPEAQAKYELQRKAGQTRVHPAARPLAWLFEPAR